MTVADALILIKPIDYKRLKLGFESGQETWAAIPKCDLFIGVNLEGVPWVEQITREGKWIIFQRRSL